MKTDERDYWVVLHRDIAKDILRIATPKERWKLHYRSVRLARKGKIVPRILGEIGVIDGFKIINGS